MPTGTSASASPREDSVASARALITRPRGRAPKGKAWDGVNGKWITKSRMRKNQLQIQKRRIKELQQQVGRLNQQLSDKIDTDLTFNEDNWLGHCQALVREQRKRGRLMLLHQQHSAHKMARYIRGAEMQLVDAEANMREVAEEITLGGYPRWAIKQLVRNCGDWLRHGGTVKKPIAGTAKANFLYMLPYCHWKDGRTGTKNDGKNAREVERVIANNEFYAQDWEVPREDLRPAWLPQ